MANRYKKRFFSNIRSYFDAKYAGRYLGIILAELARVEPETFSLVLEKAELELTKEEKRALKAGEITIDLEWWFPSQQLGKKRRADLAVYADKSKPILLIEIKDEDGISKSNEAQLKDYLSFIKKKRAVVGSRTNFLLLSRYAPRGEDAVVFQKAENNRSIQQMRHGRMHSILKGVREPGSVARMMTEYLEDVGMTYQQIDLKKDRKALIYMSSRLLGMSNKGLGLYTGAPTIESLPILMSKLFGNLAVVGDWVLSCNSGLFTQRFRRQLEVSPRYQVPKGVRSRIKNADADIVEIVNDGISVEGGSVTFFTRGSFKCPSRSQWAGVNFGYWYKIDGKDRQGLGLYVSFWWRGDDDDTRPYLETDYLKSFPSEEKIYALFSSLLKKAKNKAIRKAPASYKTLFEKFEIP